MKTKGFFIGLLLLLVLASSVFAAPAMEMRYYQPQVPAQQYQRQETKNNSNEPTVSEMLYVLMSLYDHIDKNFIFEKDNNEMMYSMIEGMINSLGDKYSYFTRPSDAANFRDENAGTFIGIGVTLQKANPSFKDLNDPSTYMVTIASPFPGGPADRAGIRAKDLISHVDGIDISDMTAEEVVTYIKGEENTPVTLTVHRNGTSFDVVVMREQVTTPITTVAIIEEDIGYLRLNNFPKTAEDTIRHDLRSLLDDGAKALILDLRNNGGGDMNDAVNIANMFLDNGTIVSVKYKDTASIDDTVYSSTSYLAFPKNYPVVILANGGSASASEILIAALKDNNRATVVGEQTFGKGIVQLVYPFVNGYISLTVGNYYTPNGISIHEVGIEPDVLVETERYTDEELEAYSKFTVDAQKTINEWIEKYPEYTLDNIYAFSSYYEDTGVPESLLNLIIRNEYIYRQEDYNANKSIVDPEFDVQLRKAIEVIKEQM